MPPLLLAVLLAAPPAVEDAPVEVPGLEHLRWGMPVEAAERRIRGMLPLLRPEPDGDTWTGARVVVAGRRATVTFRFWKRRLVALRADFEPASGLEAGVGAVAVRRVLVARYGEPYYPPPRPGLDFWFPGTTELKHYVETGAAPENRLFASARKPHDPDEAYHPEEPPRVKFPDLGGPRARP